jgi:hypothetical protein
MFVLWELFNFNCDKETESRAGLINSDFKAHRTGKDEEIKTYILGSVFLATYQNLRNEILIEKSMVAQMVNNPSILEPEDSVRQMPANRMSPQPYKSCPKSQKLFIHFNNNNNNNNNPFCG